MKSEYDLIYESITNDNCLLFKEFFCKYIVKQISEESNMLDQDEFCKVIYEYNENGFIGQFLFGLKYDYYSIDFVLDNNDLCIYGDTDQEFWNIDTDQIKECIQISKADDIFNEKWFDLFLKKLFSVQDQCMIQVGEEPL